MPVAATLMTFLSVFAAAVLVVMTCGRVVFAGAVLRGMVAAATVMVRHWIPPFGPASWLGR